MLAVSAVVRAVAGKPRKIALRGYRHCNIVVLRSCDDEAVVSTAVACHFFQFFLAEIYLSALKNRSTQSCRYGTKPSTGSDNIAIPININDLIDCRVAESNRVEFKSDWNPIPITHSIYAFANDIDNVGGGYIVVGVEEKAGTPVLPVIVHDQNF